MRLAVKENIPLVMVSDGYHEIEAMFTKEAVNEFRKNYQIKFSSLREKVILVTKWSIKITSTDSRKDFFSYQNMKVQLMIENFKPILHEKPCLRQVDTSKPIFKDLEMQTIIRYKRHEMTQQLLEHHAQYKLACSEGFSMPSVKDLMRSDEYFPPESNFMRDEENEL